MGCTAFANETHMPSTHSFTGWFFVVMISNPWVVAQRTLMSILQCLMHTVLCAPRSKFVKTGSCMPMNVLAGLRNLLHVKDPRSSVLDLSIDMLHFVISRAKLAGMQGQRQIRFPSFTLMWMRCLLRLPMQLATT